ncbi:MAG: hypothetical protein AAFN18_09300 [Cyanobacteria bacterium J06554_6]
MKPSLAVTLTDFAAALSVALNRASDMPSGLTVKCAVSRGKLMVLAQHSADSSVPARHVLAHLERLVRQQLESMGMPEETQERPDAATLPVQLYVKQSNQSRPHAAHPFVWQVSDGFEPVFGATSVTNPVHSEGSEGLVEIPSETLLEDTVMPADTPTAGESPLSASETSLPAIESTVTYPTETADPADETDLAGEVNVEDVTVENEAGPAVENEANPIIEDGDVLPVEVTSDSDGAGPGKAVAAASAADGPVVGAESADSVDPAAPLTRTALGRATEALLTKHSVVDDDDVPEEDKIFLPDEVEDDSDNRPDAVPMWDGSFSAEDIYAHSTDTPEVAAVEEEEVLTQTPMARQQRSRWWVAGVLSAILLGGVVYVVSRPCVLGGCDRIDRAESLGEAALLELADSPTPQTVLDMQQQLSDAVSLLRPIPVWSFHHSRAQTALQSYEQQLSDLESVIAAQQDATAAAEASQSPPYPVDHWQTVAAQWETAIARLQTIPAESPIYEEIVAPKLAEYQNNLATIQGRVEAELAADTSVNQATQSGSLATQQAQIATNLATWETALQSWEAAVSQLKQIPQGTLAYGEAQQLLPEYESELSQVRTRTRQERIADQFHNEAVRYAAQAREFETENQWTLAMMHWRDAISQAEGVPEGTARYTDSQNLLKTYRPAMSQAQENLRLAQRYQKAEADFVKACGNASQLCSYTMRGGKVIVKLADGYDDLIELSITPPDQRAIAAVNSSLTTRANQLLSDLTNIGKRTQLPVELQDNNGAFIARYKPELNGYVKH